MSFDAWLESPYHEGKEPPCNVTLQQDYNCTECGGDFTDEDIRLDNFEVEYEDEEYGWRAKHKDCDIGWDGD